jgi:flagellar protein FliS
VNNSHLARYQAVQIRTSSPGELLIALFDGLFRFLAVAKHAFAGGKRGQAGEALSKAYAILSELYSSLDHSKYPELCENLESLYDFSMQRITHANRHNKPEAVDDVVRVLTPVREAFTQAVRAQAAQPAAAANAEGARAY